MHTTLWRLPPPTPRWQQTLAFMLPPLTIWISVSAILRYGYYGDSRLLLGPASSRLIKTSSVFVKQLQVSNKYNHVILHAFNDKPQLSSQTNWTTSNFFLVAPYSSKGISLWLNKGSTIRMRWEPRTITGFNQLQGMVIKGGRRFEKLQPKQTSYPDAITVHDTFQGREAEYMVEEDDRYHIGVLNMNTRNIMLTMNVNVSAKVYDTSTKAKIICSTANGSCGLSFLFPNTHYVILTASSSGDDGGWYIEISYVARVLTYVLLLGFMVIVVYLILKFLGVSGGDDDQNTSVIVDTHRTSNVVAVQTETEPLMRAEQNQLSYGTNEEEDEESGASSSSSEELYDEKLCAICYDEQRNSFFVPCGHCATCYECAQRILNGESKVCPICRRLIHKVRRLFHT